MKKQYGFTLIEILLVLVIISMIILMGIGYMQQKTLSLRVDKTSLQMQQILNAGLAYYVVNSNWPPTATPGQGIAALQAANFLPNVPLNNPWGQGYAILQGPPTGTGTLAPLLYVYTNVTGTSDGTALAAATIIAGKLPLSYATATDPAAGVFDPTTPCAATSTVCYIVAAVNVPGQNLNNASAVNFAGLYHHGACVPAPQCPVDATGTAMTAQVFLVPISVSGLNDASPGQTNSYPISSFSAYVAGTANQLPMLGAAVPACQGSTITPTCVNQVNPHPATDRFWRACLQVVTEKGAVSNANGADDAWGSQVTLGAFTRCSSTTEPAGSNYTSIWSN